MKRTGAWLSAGLLLAGLILLPLVGVVLRGYPLAQYTEFPPRTRYVTHAGFSWPVFAGLAVVAAAMLAWVLVRLSRAGRARRRAVARFPAWGWAGVALSAAAWAVAWTPRPALAPLQPYVFFPLWLGYIVTVNALCLRRAGRCMLTGRPRFFLALFPVSAAFWWYFEYLNRFVQNWYYLGVRDLSPAGYFWAATLPFSTVLPAVLGTRELLVSFLGREGAPAAPARHVSRAAAGLTLLLAGAGLAMLAVWPDVLFPLLWVSPLLVITAGRALARQPALPPEPGGSPGFYVASFAAAALVCGGFWEFWNYYSQAKWIYLVPFVHRFRVFEMPLLGYAGYLPFGLECALIGDAVQRLLARGERVNPRPAGAGTFPPGGAAG